MDEMAASRSRWRVAEALAASAALASVTADFSTVFSAVFGGMVVGVRGERWERGASGAGSAGTKAASGDSPLARSNALRSEAPGSTLTHDNEFKASSQISLLAPFRFIGPFANRPGQPVRLALRA